MARRNRLDVELVRRGLARSREQAAALVSDGRVEVRGLVAAKAAALVDPADPVRVVDSGPDYVSRGGHKLAGALAAFGGGDSNAFSGGDSAAFGGGDSAAFGGGDSFGGLKVGGRRCLDAGASTGGFTDVLLRAGAAEVVAVDVGYGQLAWSLRTDERVRVLDRQNVRVLTPEVIGGPADLTVADLSFISLTLVLPALAECTTTDLLPMVKPQFEVGKDRVGPGGVVRDPALWAEAVTGVASSAADLGFGVAGITRSPLPGPAGNVEFFLWLRRDARPLDPSALETVTA